jgi:O-antigen/teichoic acid export membrane protein
MPVTERPGHPEPSLAVEHDAAAGTGTRMFSAAVLFLLARGAGILLGFGVTLLLARALSRSDFATLALGLAMVVFGTTLSDGVNSVLMRESIRTPEDEAGLVPWARRFRFLTGLASALLVAGVSLPLVDEPDQWLTIVLLSLALPLLAPTVLYSVLQRRYLAGRVALLMLLQSAQWLIAVAVLAWLGAPLIGYGLAYALSTLLYAVEVTVVARKVGCTGRVQLGARATWIRLRHAVPLGLTSILAIAYAKLDGMLLYAIQGAAASAGYAAAYRLLDVGNVLPASLNAVFFPMFTYELRDRPSALSVSARWMRLSLLVSAPAVVLGELVADPVAGLVFGPRYPDTVLLLRLLLPSFVLVCFEWVFVSMATATGLARRQLQVSVVGVIVNVAANLVAIPVWGARACCLTTLVTELVVVGLSWFFLRGRLPGPVWPSRGYLARLGLVLAVASTPAVVLPPIVAGTVFLVVFIAGAVPLRLVKAEDYTLAVSPPPATGAG